MARINITQIVMALALTAVMLQGISAEDHTVGGNAGWTNTANVNYTALAANTRFEVGDELVFNFATNSHNVAQVSKAGYDSCNGANPISLTTSGPATIRLNTTGPHYFICTVGSHCANGQKLTVNVVADDDTPPAPGTPPSTGNAPPGSNTSSNGNTTSSPPPPAGSSAGSRGVAFGFVLVSLAVAFFSC